MKGHEGADEPLKMSTIFSFPSNPPCLMHGRVLLCMRIMGLRIFWGGALMVNFDVDVPATNVLAVAGSSEKGVRS